ncbi:MAG: response regulator transcription factor [Ignavibacterium sp.]|nr:response regulator transcription factor [Ignavibacterium sp.]
MKKLKLYLVDDSPYVRRSLARVFSEIKKVELIGEAENLKNAVEFLTKYNPEVCIFDYNLPDGTAIDLIKYSKNANDKVVNIVISNMADEKLKKVILKSGADYFFDKSEEIDELTSLIEKLASQV